MFLTKKNLWNHIDRTSPKPTVTEASTSTDKAKLAQWITDDAKTITWILGSVEPQFVLPLRIYKNARDLGTSEKGL